MKTVSLEIDDVIFSETEKILTKVKMPRNRYINDAIKFYNQMQEQKILEQKIRKESLLVRDDSMDVLNDFEGIDYGH